MPAQLMYSIEGVVEGGEICEGTTFRLPRRDMHLPIKSENSSVRFTKCLTSS